MNFSDNSGIKFVIVTSDDYLRYIELQKEFYEEIKQYRKLWYIKIHSKEEFERILFEQNERASYKLYFAQTDQLLIGYFISKTIKKVIFVEELYVRKSYRLRDIGKSIILFLEREGLVEQIRLISIFVDFKNESGMRFLEKCGFTKEKIMTAIEKIGYSKRIL